MTELRPARKLTNGPRHHFFGFHDLEISSKASGSVLALAVDRIDRPPTPDDAASVCIIDPDDVGSLKDIAITTTFNFPQGARQQWLGKSDDFIVNQRRDRNSISSIFNAQTGRKLEELSFGVHIVDRMAERGYSIDYGRLHRLGGYGYVGVEDRNPDDAAPADNGIFVVDLKTKAVELLISIADVVQNNERARKVSADHFFTHLSLSPDGKRLAFLHRYRLPDGGEDTCLMTVGSDGKDCRLLAQGFLSHFDWVDDRSILIWGRKNSAVSDFRNSAILQIPALRAGLVAAKKIVRPIISRTAAMQCSFLIISDRADPLTKEIGVGVLRTDGHPMVNPKNRDWIVVDTYPDETGFRELLLFRFSDHARIDLGRFKMSDEKPSEETVRVVAQHIRQFISVPFSPQQYAFTRSGLHCDLHPRWFADGERVAFDSIHEGSRQLYCVDVGELVHRQ